MNVNMQRTGLTRPVPSGTPARPYPLSRPAHTQTSYDVSGVIDTVEIHRSNFQALSANRQVKNLSTATTGKGVYIDLWA
ncbi:MAG: hypothetical protein V1766_13380 [Pseudomonadota bacterium]